MDMDIDIDVADRKQIISLFNVYHAVTTDGSPHNTGIYPQDIPHNPINNIATIDYKLAAKRQYFKIDILNVSLYKQIKDESHLISLLHTEPIWELLCYPEFSSKLFHVSGYSELLVTMKPDSVEKLAAFISLIRPAKKYLIGRPWEDIMKEIWVKPNSNEYYFKKSHAVAYAMTIVVQMNLLCQLS